MEVSRFLRNPITVGRRGQEADGTPVPPSLPPITTPEESRRRREPEAPAQVPELRHLALIVDGNRTWAKARGLSTMEGHRAGGNKVLEVLDWCEDYGIRTVTFWALSMANLDRPAAQLDPLLAVIEDGMNYLADADRWSVNPIGAFDLLPPRTARAMRAVKERSAQSAGMRVNVAVGYGGRQELVDAVRRSVAELAARGLGAEEIAGALDEQAIARHLYTSGQPDPDLVIRTSGAQRLSGFMPWQGFQSELYFCSALWPDLTRDDFDAALESYRLRSRTRGV
ncbi:polyprenyl diphosphate synthase [Streptomyces sp. NPDC054841]